MSDFYVYEHWRPDLATCFYVGKGKLKRVRDLSRSEHHARIDAEVAAWWHRYRKNLPKPGGKRK